MLTFHTFSSEIAFYLNGRRMGLTILIDNPIIIEACFVILFAKSNILFEIVYTTIFLL